MAKTIAVIGALDTKGDEFAFVKREIERRGHHVVMVDTGVVGQPAFKPDVAAQQIADAGGTSLQQLRETADRGQAMNTMADGVAKVVEQLHRDGKIHAVLGMGGGAGTALGTSAMRSLPVGVPKVMVSTVASGDTSGYVGTRDVVMIPSVVDVAGINRISARIYANAVGAVVGMVETVAPPVDEKPMVAMSMFGNTTPIAERCRQTMESHGYEVLVFHATGTGGRTMEDILAGGIVSGVLDITTTEWADELMGGVMAAGTSRLDAAASSGVPQVVVPGCLDMVNFWGIDTVPKEYRDRRLYQWNSNITLMRTTPQENAELGRVLADKVNRSSAPVALFLPLNGLSILGGTDGEFWWPEADKALFDAIVEHTREDIPVYKMANNINDDDFADAVVSKMLEFLC